jgi:hypothetical protein
MTVIAALVLTALAVGVVLVAASRAHRRREHDRAVTHLQQQLARKD